MILWIKQGTSPFMLLRRCTSVLNSFPFLAFFPFSLLPSIFFIICSKNSLLFYSFLCFSSNPNYTLIVGPSASYSTFLSWFPQGNKKEVVSIYVMSIYFSGLWVKSKVILGKTFFYLETEFQLTLKQMIRIIF